MTGTLLMGCAAVSAMDSTTLLNNPDRYRVVSTQPDGVVYVDMDSIKSMQTRDKVQQHLGCHDFPAESGHPSDQRIFGDASRQ